MKGNKKAPKPKRKVSQVVSDDEKKLPKSFVFKRGNIGRVASQLVQDFRNLMRPLTAVRLQESKHNTIRDFVHVAGPLGVTHFVIFSLAESGLIMRMMKAPHGPTLTFRINKFSLARDVLSVTKNPISTVLHHKHSPLVVLNNFHEKENHIRLMAVMFQNMFPSINIQTIKLGDCKRILLLNYDAETKTIELRHYAIQVGDVGVSKTIRKIVKAHIPSLDNVQDIGDFVLGGEGLSDSEAEDVGDNRVELPETQKPGKKDAPQANPKLSAIKLKEIGPRMQIELLKIEEGLGDGEVMFHAFVHKSEDEIHQLRVMSESRRKEKERRKSIQAENVKRKKLLESKAFEDAKVDRGVKSAAERDNAEDDAEYYRQEVGQEPDADFIKSAGQSAPKREKFNPIYKKRKSKAASEREAKASGKGAGQQERITSEDNPISFVKTKQMKRKPVGIALNSAAKKAKK
eukprot:TRINITY_DN3713_c0_g1_i1.p1 TRINITY_DN3713_c0_g1~~TRINITY_DN3713_c0_g1_i1.p1  ORF type:complete len:459 (-),score=127.16 TRINITY_DN3713_c0_g1_i1:118-1494(-)